MWIRAVERRWSWPRRHSAAEPILATYSSPAFWQRHRKKLLVVFSFFTLIYGAAFGLTTTYFLVQLTVPLVLLAAAVVWLLPETEAAPVDLLSKLLFAFLIVLLLWPDYLAITLPGMPWITAVRVVGVPLAFVMLVCLSTSAEVRADLAETLSAVPLIWKLIVTFAVIVVLSVGWSTNISNSTSKLVIAALNWFLIFFVSVYVFRRPGRVVFLAYLLWAIVIILFLIGIQEWRFSQVPWAGHIPSFLTVDDPTVQRVLTGSARAATGIYRIQSKFTTPLAFAEYYSLAVPFVIHFAFNARVILVRVAAALTLPLMFWIIILTDSRLGVVGFFLACVFYLAVWAAWRWRRDSDSIIGPAVIVSYPATFALFIASTFFVRRMEALVWGSGAQQASTDSRMTQVTMAIPKIGARPWGYGIGQGGDALGFVNRAGTGTIDSYFISAVLEFGVLGFFVFYAIFISGIWNGVRRIWSTYDYETDFIAPLTVALSNFFVIKSIFSQPDNHGLVFTMVGALVALCWRIDKNRRITI